MSDAMDWAAVQKFGQAPTRGSRIADVLALVSDYAADRLSLEGLSAGIRELTDEPREATGEVDRFRVWAVDPNGPYPVSRWQVFDHGNGGAMLREYWDEKLAHEVATLLNGR